MHLANSLPLRKRGILLNSGTVSYGAVLVIEFLAGLLITSTYMGEYGMARIWTLLGIGLGCTGGICLWCNDWRQISEETTMHGMHALHHLLQHCNRWLCIMALLYPVYRSLTDQGNWISAASLVVALASALIEMRQPWNKTLVY